MISQPAMSPDLNVLDLGFVNSSLSVITETCVTHVINSVRVFRVHSSTTKLRDLQDIYNKYIKEEGSNKYNLPNVHKQKLMKEGWLPTNMTICSNALAVMKEHNEYLEKEKSRKQAGIDHASQ